MQNSDDSKLNSANTNNEGDNSRKKQQQSDPQITELKGFFDKDEKLEPELEDDKESKDKEKNQ